MRKFRGSAARRSNLARHSKGELPTVCMADALELLRPLQPTVLECLGWVAATQLLSTRRHALGADFVQTMLMKLEQHDVTLDPKRRPSAGNLIQQLYAAVCQEMLMFNPPAHAPSPWGVFLEGIPSSPVMCPRLGSPCCTSQICARRVFSVVATSIRYGTTWCDTEQGRHSGRLSRVSGFAGLGETHLVMMCVEMQGWNCGGGLSRAPS